MRKIHFFGPWLKIENKQLCSRAKKKTHFPFVISISFAICWCFSLWFFSLYRFVIFPCVWFNKLSTKKKMRKENWNNRKSSVYTLLEREKKLFFYDFHGLFSILLCLSTTHDFSSTHLRPFFFFFLWWITLFPDSLDI